MTGLCQSSATASTSAAALLLLLLALAATPAQSTLVSLYFPFGPGGIPQVGVAGFEQAGFKTAVLSAFKNALQNIATKQPALSPGFPAPAVPPPRSWQFQAVGTPPFARVIFDYSAPWGPAISFLIANPALIYSQSGVPGVNLLGQYGGITGNTVSFALALPPTPPVQPPPPPARRLLQTQAASTVVSAANLLRIFELASAEPAGMTFDAHHNAYELFSTPVDYYTAESACLARSLNSELVNYAAETAHEFADALCNAAKGQVCWVQGSTAAGMCSSLASSDLRPQTSCSERHPFICVKSAADVAAAAAATAASVEDAVLAVI